MRTAPSNWREAFPILAGYSREHFDYAAQEALTPNAAKILRFVLRA
jgi:hypothetical protein